MKRIFALCLALATIFTTANAAFTPAAETKSEAATAKKEKFGAFKNADRKAAAELFVNMTRKDYEQLTGKRMSLMERAAFKVQQKRMKNELKKVSGDSGSIVIGLLAGLILSLVGVLLVYIFSDDSTMRTWSWIGFLVSLIVFGAFII